MKHHSHPEFYPHKPSIWGRLALMLVLLMTLFFAVCGAKCHAAPTSISISSQGVTINVNGQVTNPAGSQLVQSFTASTRAATVPVATGQLGWETDSGHLYLATGTSAGQWTLAGSSGGTWGTITGTLASQSDLATALNGKAASSLTVNGHALTGNVTIATGDISGLQTALDGKLAVGAAVAWSQLTGVPALFSGAYADLTGKPALFSGSYTDLTSKPTLGTAAAAATTDFDAAGAAAAVSASLTTALAGKVATTITVNGHALSSNITVSQSDVGLGNVENTALSTWAGSTNVTTLGTISAGLWHGTAIGDSYISSAATWNAKQSPATTLAGYGITDAVAATITVNGHALSANVTVSKGDVSLGNVENTAISTWAGSTSLTTLGTISAGLWHGTAIGDSYISSAATWNAKQSPATTLAGYGITDAVANTITVNGHALSSNITVSKSDVGLGSVENTALSTWTGSTNLTTLGTISAGLWHGTAVADSYIASAATWNAKQSPATTLAGYGITNGVANTITVNGHALSANVTVSKSDVSLGSVENTALSTWSGSSNLTTLGTISTGTWHGTAVADSYIASAGTWNAKQSALTFSTGLVNTSGTITVDTGTSANKIVKLDGSGKLPAVDGSQLTGISGGGSALTDPHVAYLRSDGNDSTGDGSPGKPYATIQAASYAGFVCFNLGYGNFGNLTVNNTTSISLTGVGWAASSIGSISTDLSYLLIHDVGGSVFVAGDIKTGGAGTADSGNLDLYDVRCSGYVITSGASGVGGTAGPSGGSSGYNAGNITMHGACYASLVYLDGGNGGNAGFAAVAQWAQDQMNFSPGNNYNLVVTTPLASRTFAFAPSDPSNGSIWLGDASGVPSADFGTLANAVSAEASALGVTYTLDGGAFKIVLTANTLGGGFTISDAGSTVNFSDNTAGSGYAYAGSGGNPGTLLIYGPCTVPGGSLLGGTAGTGLDNHGVTTSAPSNGTVTADGADLRGGTLTAGQVTLGRCSYQTGSISYSSFLDNGGNAIR